MSISDKEQTRWTARSATAVGMAALACLLAFLLLYQDREAAAGAEGLWAFVAEVLLGHAAGGFVAGWVLAPLFGRRGIVGWLLAFVGGALASLLAGLVGGALSSLPVLIGGQGLATYLVGLGGGALVKPFAMANAPWVVVVWLAVVVGLHLVSAKLRSI